MEAGERIEAEREIEERNYLKYAQKKRMPGAFKEFDLNEDDDEDINLKYLRRK